MADHLVVVAVADHAALRRPGRPRRVDVREEVVLADRGGARSRARWGARRRARGPAPRARRGRRSESTCCSAGARARLDLRQLLRRPRPGRPTASEWSSDVCGVLGRADRVDRRGDRADRARGRSRTAHHSASCRARIPNASPLLTPSESSPLASSSTRVAASAQETRCQCRLRLDEVGRVRSARLETASRQSAGDRSRGRRRSARSVRRVAIAMRVSAYPRGKRSGRERAAEGEERAGPTRLLEGPMRTIWNGSISFGLVNIPVGLAPATKPAARQSDVSFRTLHRECGTPIKQKRWCPHARPRGRRRRARQGLGGREGRSS